MISAKEISVYSQNVRSHPHPLPSPLRAELSVTPPLLLFGNPAASQPARRSLGFAPPPHDEFAFIATQQRQRV